MKLADMIIEGGAGLVGIDDEKGVKGALGLWLYLENEVPGYVAEMFATMAATTHDGKSDGAAFFTGFQLALTLVRSFGQPDDLEFLPNLTGEANGNNTSKA